nr:MAG TPA: hypothetical protein [Caudoviricetes sp.]
MNPRHNKLLTLVGKPKECRGRSQTSSVFNALCRARRRVPCERPRIRGRRATRFSPLFYQKEESRWKMKP